MPVCSACRAGGRANQELARLTDEGNLQAADQARDDALEHHASCVGSDKCSCRHAVGYGLIRGYN